MGDSLKPYYKAAPMPGLEVGTYSAGNEEGWWCFKQGNGEIQVPREEVNRTALWKVKCITQMSS